MDNIHNAMHNLVKNEPSRSSEPDLLQEIASIFQKPQHAYHPHVSQAYNEVGQKHILEGTPQTAHESQYYRHIPGSMASDLATHNLPTNYRPMEERQSVFSSVLENQNRDTQNYPRLISPTRLFQSSMKTYEHPTEVSQDKGFPTPLSLTTSDSLRERIHHGAFDANPAPMYAGSSYKHYVVYSEASSSGGALMDTSSNISENICPERENDSPKTEIYKCHLCPEFETPSVEELSDHVEAHSREKNFNYQTESFSDIQQDSNNRPISPEEVKIPLKCSLCSFTCVNSEELENHSNVHLQADSTVFDLSTQDVQNLPKSPEETQNPVNEPVKNLKCFECDFQTTKARELREHCQANHPGDCLYKCADCPYSTSLQKNFTKHLYSHMEKQEHKCDICNFVCYSNDKLRSHIRNHSVEKTYKCDLCPYETVGKSHLVKHLRIHTGEKLFSCESCSYSTAEKGNLTKHMKTHTGEKSFMCQVCNYRTAELGNFTKHIKTHTGEKNLKCDLCSYCTSDKGNLSKHKRTHTREKLFKCDLCSYATHEKSNLNKHRRIHKDAKAFSCKFCDFQASSSKRLVSHLESHVEEKQKVCRDQDTSTEVWEPECIVKTE